MVRTFAYIFAFVFIAISIAGFTGWGMHEGHLMNMFVMNHWNSVDALVTGLFAALAGYAGGCWPKVYFKVFGILLILLAGFGFYYGNELIFGYFASNMANSLFHGVAGLIALSLGFGCCKKKENS